MQHIRWQTPVIEIVHGLAAIIVALAVIGVGYAQGWPLEIAIGVNDNAFVEHIGGLEYGDGRMFRWTKESSQLFLPQPPLNTAAVLTLRLQDGRKVRPEHPELSIRANTSELVRFELPKNVPRLYALLIPPVEQPGKNLEIDLQATALQERANARWLGVAIFHATLSPTRGSVWLPSLWVGLCAAALGLGTYLTARLAGLRPARGLLIVAGSAAIVGVGMAALPSDILPFIQRLAGVALIAGLGLGLARLLTPTIPSTSQDQPGPVSRPQVAGAHLPIYLALGTWMLLIFQQYMAWDGAKNIGGLIWDIWIGVGLGVLFGLGLIIWWALRRRGSPLVAGYARQAQVALVVLGLAAGLRIGLSSIYIFTHQASDFWVHFRGVREWMRGAPLYNLEEIRANHFGKVFKIPPFYGMLYMPFVRSIGGEVLIFWQRVFNAVLLAGVGLVWLRMWRLPVRSLEGLALLIVFCSRPIVDSLTYGQTDVILLCLLTLALWALREERDGLAGALVAVAAMLKLYPLVLLAFFVIKRHWGSLWGFGLATLAINAITLVVMGWDVHWIFLTQVLPTIGGTTAWVENQTISGFLARFVASPTKLSGLTSGAMSLAGTLISGLALLGVCGLALRNSERRSSSYALQYGMFVLTMALCVPVAWMHYQTLLVLLFAALLQHLRDRQVSLGYAVGLGLSFGLISYGNQWSFFNDEILGLFTWVGLSYKFYGMLLLAGLAGAVLVGRQQQNRSPRSETAVASDT